MNLTTPSGGSMVMLDISTKGLPSTTSDNLGSMIELISSKTMQSMTYVKFPTKTCIPLILTVKLQTPLFEFFLVCVYLMKLCSLEGTTQIEKPKINTVLDEFKGRFKVPTSLSPRKSHDRYIPLIPNTPPVNKRPYKHPSSQKDAIEQLVKELLEARVIRSSQSSFSSPIVMVKKKYGSWRMCVDYRSKYTFAMLQVEYLGHIISDKGVATDPSKIEAIKDWHVSKNVEQLRRFLDLTSYYRRFIKGVYTDVCGTGIGAVLLHDGHPLAYLSKALSPKHQALSTYEKEFLAVILALEKWKGYLMDMHFKIKIDHFTAQVAQVFLDNVYKLYGLPNTIVSDKDKMLLSYFWQSLFKVLKVKLQMPTAYHPQSDCQTKVVNRGCLGLPEATPYKQVTARKSTYNNLLAKYYDPFKIVEKIGSVAYKFQLLSGSQIHQVFHVSQLMLCKEIVYKPGTPPMCDNEGLLYVFPLKIIDKRLGKMDDKVVAYVLV
uniref:Uncharacterized mitochondrial protein AtMg00860-like n=1 Tax=Tanacetum cinerariifolium TaxID=118510 RepID=A0A6L2M9H8_TANCI|nr:uncharacterized mitochondrial protein AtMg00860-like [Tanacetum cinerariifolium]